MCLEGRIGEVFTSAIRSSSWIQICDLGEGPCSDHAVLFLLVSVASVLLREGGMVSKGSEYGSTVIQGGEGEGGRSVCKSLCVLARGIKEGRVYVCVRACLIHLPSMPGCLTWRRRHLSHKLSLNHPSHPLSTLLP